jgi:iron complex outermembrane recepter protein
MRMSKLMVGATAPPSSATKEQSAHTLSVHGKESSRPRRSVFRGLLLGFSAITFGAVLTTAGAAEEAGTTSANNGSPLDEIVVTATRQATPLSKVPVSVAAISQEQMDVQGLRDISDITRVTPGISLTPNGGVAGTNTVISIRGISSTVGSPTTGVYIDDTPIQGRPLGSANNVYPQLFDLERVEVLRGPQGTLFGAGAEGGAIRFITP